jgi:hypothetical protein
MTPRSEIVDALRAIEKSRAMEQAAAIALLSLIAHGRVSRVDRVNVADPHRDRDHTFGGFEDVLVHTPTADFDVDAACGAMSTAVANLVRGAISPIDGVFELTLLDGLSLICEDDGVPKVMHAEDRDALLARVRFIAGVRPDHTAAPLPVPEAAWNLLTLARERQARVAYVDPVTFRELALVGNEGAEMRVERDNLGEYFTVVSPALRVRVQSTAAIGAPSAMQPTETRWYVTNPHDQRFHPRHLHREIMFERTPLAKLVAEHAGFKLEAIAHGPERARLRIRNHASALVADVNVSKLDTDPNLTVSCMRVGAALLWDLEAGDTAWRAAGDDE